MLRHKEPMRLPLRTRPSTAIKGLLPPEKAGGGRAKTGAIPGITRHVSSFQVSKCLDLAVSARGRAMVSTLTACVVVSWDCCHAPTQRDESVSHSTTGAHGKDAAPADFLREQIADQ